MMHVATCLRGFTLFNDALLPSTHLISSRVAVANVKNALRLSFRVCSISRIMEWNVWRVQIVCQSFYSTLFYFFF